MPLSKDILNKRRITAPWLKGASTSCISCTWRISLIRQFFVSNSKQIIPVKEAKNPWSVFSNLQHHIVKTIWNITCHQFFWTIKLEGEANSSSCEEIEIVSHVCAFILQPIRFRGLSDSITRSLLLWVTLPEPRTYDKSFGASYTWDGIHFHGNLFCVYFTSHGTTIKLNPTSYFMESPIGSSLEAPLSNQCWTLGSK